MNIISCGRKTRTPKCHGCPDPIHELLRQRDNFRFGQREYFRFFGLRYSFFRKEDQPYAGGTDYVDQEATWPA